MIQQPPDKFFDGITLRTPEAAVAYLGQKLKADSYVPETVRVDGSLSSGGFESQLAATIGEYRVGGKRVVPRVELRGFYGTATLLDVSRLLI